MNRTVPACFGTATRWNGSVSNLRRHRAASRLFLDVLDDQILLLGPHADDLHLVAGARFRAQENAHHHVLREVDCRHLLGRARDLSIAPSTRPAVRTVTCFAVCCPLASPLAMLVNDGVCAAVIVHQNTHAESATNRSVELQRLS